MPTNQTLGEGMIETKVDVSPEAVANRVACIRVFTKDKPAPVADMLEALAAKLAEVERSRDEWTNTAVQRGLELEATRDSCVGLRQMIAHLKDDLTAAQATIAQLREESESDAVKAAVEKIASVAAAVGMQANVGATETAGLIVSVLYANPHLQERFMKEGTELFIDGTMMTENGSLTFLSRAGEILTPAELMRRKNGRESIQ